MRFLFAVIACHLANCENVCAPDEVCALDETALLQMKPMRSLTEVDQEGEEGETEGEETEGLLHRRRRGKKFGHAITGAIKKGREIANHDITKAVVRTAKNHLSKALALVEEVDDESEESVADEESGAEEETGSADEVAEDETEAAEGEEDLEGPFHRRRRGKKFGHGIKKAVGVAKKVANHDITKAVVRTAKQHLNKALALLEDDIDEDDDEDDDEDADEETAGPFHRRRRGKKFGHGLVKAAKVAKKVYDHPVGKAAITAAVAR